jgi:hypothetical protein
MESPAFVRLQDRIASRSDGAISPHDLQGIWVNTEGQSRGIVKAAVDARDHLRVRVFGAGESGPRDWGWLDVDALYAAAPDACKGIGFTATYVLPSAKVDLHANLSKGLLIIASLTSFHDGSGRSNYFAREFFRRADGDKTS